MKTDTPTTTEELQRERLDRLIKHMEWIEETEPERFDLDSWMRGDVTRAMTEWPQRFAEGRELNCNTTACVAGNLPLLFPESWRWEITSHYTVVCPSNIEDAEAWWSDIEDGTVMAGLLAEFLGGTTGEWYSTIYLEHYDEDPVELRPVLERLRAIRDRTFDPDWLAWRFAL
jgi:hypothetical protein